MEADASGANTRWRLKPATPSANGAMPSSARHGSHRARRARVRRWTNSNRPSPALGDHAEQGQGGGRCRHPAPSPRRDPRARSQRTGRRQDAGQPRTQMESGGRRDGRPCLSSPPPHHARESTWASPRSSCAPRRMRISRRCCAGMRDPTVIASGSDDPNAVMAWGEDNDWAENIDLYERDVWEYWIARALTAVPSARCSSAIRTGNRRTTGATSSPTCARSTSGSVSQMHAA